LAKVQVQKVNSIDHNIGIMNETSLHASLKSFYALPGDQLEQPVDGYMIDIVRDEQLIEIQTKNFYAMKSKLNALLGNYFVRLVHPIAYERWIERVSEDGQLISRRKSPKRGYPEELFSELVRIPELASHPHLSIEVLMTQEEVVWRDDGQGSWRRKGWSVADRCLIQVLSRRLFEKPEDFVELIPVQIEQSFTNRDLVEHLGIKPRVAGQMTNCLRKMGLVEKIGHEDRYYLYQKTKN
jgi:hypothetical protein